MRTPSKQIEASSAPIPLRIARPAASCPALVNGLIALTVCGGVAALCVSLWTYADDPLHAPIIFVIAAFVLGTVRLSAYGDWISLALIPIMSASYLYGPAGGIIVGFAGALGAATRANRFSRKTAFNLGLFALVGGTAALAGRPALLHQATIVSFVAYGLVVAITTYLANASLLSAVIALDTRGNVLAVWRERFRWMLPQTLVMGQVATGLAVAYHAIGGYEVATYGLPILAMQIGVRQYLARTTRGVEDLREKNAELLGLTTSLQTANEAVNEAYSGTLEALVIALDARDNEVQGHSVRVSLYSQIIAEAMGVVPGSADWEAISRGALLHDIGKIGVADAVLRKPGPLDDNEWVEMRRHTDIGFSIMEDVKFLQPAALLVRAHHERFDGKGYPKGLAGDQIPFGARIFAVSDTFDAITSDRPYRRGATPEVAVAEIQRCAGTQFDPAVVTVFVQVWQRLWAIRETVVPLAA